MNTNFQIVPYTEHGFLVRFLGIKDVIKTGIHAALLAQKMNEVSCWLDVTPGVDSLAARFDPDKINYGDARIAFEKTVCVSIGDVLPPPVKTLEIPVCYEEKYGPDLKLLSEQSGQSEQKLIDLHTYKPVRVISMGFAPGFAYLGSVDEQLQLPRRRSPRISVPAGSVGIADQFTGIYSMQSPGGWQIIGRTPINLIIPNQHEPFLLQPNVEVRFRAVDEQEYLAIEQEQNR